MRSDYYGYNQGNKNNLPTFIYDYPYDSDSGTYSGTKSFDAVKYGVFLADYAQRLSDSGVPVTYLATSKEWAGVMTATRAKKTIETMIDTLAAKCVEMPLIINNGAWSLSKVISTVNSYISNDVNQHVYGYSSHNYSSSETKTWTDFGNVVSTSGKLAFNDETSHGGGGQTTEEEEAITKVLFQYTGRCNMYTGDVQGECYFDLWIKASKFSDYNGFIGPDLKMCHKSSMFVLQNENTSESGTIQRYNKNSKMG